MDERVEADWEVTGVLWRVASVAPLVTTTLVSASPTTPIAARAPARGQALLDKIQERRRSTEQS
jgi:hypothetical protein